ncbi:AbrB/MazE/SpoVT family DNA-binding domain-containing protein [Psychrobacillus sp. NPDC093180]|uniref:AbrB/MazE/SpoVT family DNA-binding domain-containing protein n=1 Tax=Psychrobacillus sp. NPDC093180 TaxID=3364489 RepID=UPI00381B63F2
MVTKVSQWGNSLGVRIPKTIADKLNIKEGTEMNMYADDNMITLEPVKTRYTLEELVSQITDENKHSSIESGEPMGDELI